MSTPPQHSRLTGTRWAEFSHDQQILMIANEMHRAAHLIGLGAWDRVHSGLERVLQLTDLTISCATSPTRRRELLRWRDLAAALYLQAQPDGETHSQALHCLLQLTPIAFQQTSALFGDHRKGSAELRTG